ncbi:MAG TPA: DinB family protein [Chloroflexota bacterium]
MTTPGTDAYARALEILAATPPILRALAGAGSAETLARRPTVEGWSAREVLAHLWRAETFVGARIRSMLEQDEPLFEPPVYGQAPEDLGDLLREWDSARTANLALFGSLTPRQGERGGRHPRHGRITVREHVVEWAYHDLDHLRQIMGAWQVELYPSIGSFQGLYPPPA